MKNQAIEDKAVEWFEKVIRNIQNNIIAQKTYLEQVLNQKPERLVLGKKTYKMLNDVFDFKNKGNTMFGLSIAIDCEDDWLIAVCHGSKSDAKVYLLKDKED